MRCVRRVKIYFISLDLVVFFPLFISLCGVACRGFNFAHERLCTTRVRQPEGSKQININHFTQGKKHILQGLSRSDSLIHLHVLPCMATLYRHV